MEGELGGLLCADLRVNTRTVQILLVGGGGGTGRLSGGHQQTIQGAASNCPAKQIVVRNKKWH